MNSYGFIITRHVNSELTNKYWNNSVKQLRRFYPFRKIVIIDDNSNPQFLKAEEEYENVTIINSEFKGRGELLPYYYYSKTKFFDNAIIIHDSVFFHKRVNFDILKKVNVLPLWYFHPDRENVENSFRISNILNNKWEIQNKINMSDVILGLQHLKWYGCFGCQSYINHNFLLSIENKYHISKMVYTVQNRKDRCCLERILGAIFFTEYQCQKIINRKSLLGNIMTYHRWGYSYNDYQNDLKKGTITKGIVKIWTGR